MLRVIIAGGRSFNDYERLKRVMGHLLSKTTEEIVIVCGMARGADSLGEQYAKEKGYEVRRFPADWKGLGKSAGYKRNEQMAQNADALVAFWDGQSRGTKHMIDLACKYGLKVCVIKYE